MTSEDFCVTNLKLFKKGFNLDPRDFEQGRHFLFKKQSNGRMRLKWHKNMLADPTGASCVETYERDYVKLVAVPVVQEDGEKKPMFVPESDERVKNDEEVEVRCMVPGTKFCELVDGRQAHSGVLWGKLKPGMKLRMVDGVLKPR